MFFLTSSNSCYTSPSFLGTLQLTLASRIEVILEGFQVNYYMGCDISKIKSTVAHFLLFGFYHLNPIHGLDAKTAKNRNNATVHEYLLNENC